MCLAPKGTYPVYVLDKLRAGERSRHTPEDVRKLWWFPTCAVDALVHHSSKDYPVASDRGIRMVVHMFLVYRAQERLTGKCHY